jgi:PAS domain S-box-containing protein
MPAPDGTSDPEMHPADNPATSQTTPRRPEVPERAPAAVALQALPQGVAVPVRLIWESLIPITLQDSAFKLVDVNAAYLRFTGQPRDKLIGRDPLEFQPARDRVNSLLLRARLNAEATPATGAMPEAERLLDAHGHERWFRASRSPVTDLHGRLFWVSVLQDCTLEQAERVRALGAENEVAHWFDLSVQGMVLYDDKGRLLRGNRAFEALTGPLVGRLTDASPALQQLLAWTDAGPAAQLQPGAEPLQRQAWVAPCAALPTCRAGSVAWRWSKTCRWKKSATWRVSSATR